MPVDLESLSGEFELPPGWTVESSIVRGANGRYEVLEPEKAVFFVGGELRKTSKTIDGMALETVLAGAWPFKDSDVSKAATRVMQKYLALTGFKLPVKSTIMIAPLPVAAGITKWRAETRGSTVVLLIDPNASLGTGGSTERHLHARTATSLGAQLAEAEGDYDWFFEGFTLYTALRTALELKIINFKDSSTTLARVYDSYLSYTDTVSLIDASERRWTTPGSLVYDKGMLVAFLYDLDPKGIWRQDDTRGSLPGVCLAECSDQAQANEAIIACWVRRRR